MTLRLAQAHIYACISTIVLLVGIVSTDEIYLLAFRLNQMAMGTYLHLNMFVYSYMYFLGLD